MSKREMPKVDLTLLKKLVAELETAATAAHELPMTNKEEVHTFITELAKASGLAASVAQEASMLVKDMYQISKMSQNPMMTMSEEDILAQVFGEAPSLIVDPDKKNRN